MANKNSKKQPTQAQYVKALERVRAAAEEFLYRTFSDVNSPTKRMKKLEEALNSIPVLEKLAVDMDRVLRLKAKVAELETQHADGRAVGISAKKQAKIAKKLVNARAKLARASNGQ